jgi:hypothetical protein
VFATHSRIGWAGSSERRSGDFDYPQANSDESARQRKPASFSSCACRPTRSYAKPAVARSVVREDRRLLNTVDSILKSFSISFLLRCLFAGAFFLISFIIASRTPQELSKLDVTVVLTVTLPVSLFAGVTAYGLHRSLVYPLIEWMFDTERAKKMRKGMPLISDSTINSLLRRWDRATEDQSQLGCERGRRLTVWADYTQLQYTSVICIILGAIFGVIVVPGLHGRCWPLINFAVILFIAAAISDWRLRSVDARCSESNEPPPFELHSSLSNTKERFTRSALPTSLPAEHFDIDGLVGGNLQDAAGGEDGDGVAG